MKKELAEIFMDENGMYKIRTGKDIWIDDFDTEEEATTYALRNGCRVKGC
jgi:hypothetical protein